MVLKGFLWQYCLIWSGLSPFFPADLSQVWPEANQHFSKEIDDEANSYFQRIYNHPPHPTMSVDEVSF